MVIQKLSELVTKPQMIKILQNCNRLSLMSLKRRIQRSQIKKKRKVSRVQKRKNPK